MGRSPGWKFVSWGWVLSMLQSWEALIESWACRIVLYSREVKLSAAGLFDTWDFPKGDRGWNADSSWKDVCLVVACL